MLGESGIRSSKRMRNESADGVGWRAGPTVVGETEVAQFTRAPTVGPPGRTYIIPPKGLSGGRYWTRTSDLLRVEQVL